MKFRNAMEPPRATVGRYPNYKITLFIVPGMPSPMPADNSDHVLFASGLNRTRIRDRRQDCLTDSICCLDPSIIVRPVSCRCAESLLWVLHVELVWLVQNYCQMSCICQPYANIPVHMAVLLTWWLPKVSSRAEIKIHNVPELKPCLLTSKRLTQHYCIVILSYSVIIQYRKSYRRFPSNRPSVKVEIFMEWRVLLFRGSLSTSPE